MACKRKKLLALQQQSAFSMLTIHYDPNITNSLEHGFLFQVATFFDVLHPTISQI